MKMGALSKALVVLGLCLAIAPAWAGQDAISYQGVLADGGEAFTGSASITFSLWNDPSAGTQVWGPETLAGVSVSNGVFAVLLGGTVPFNTVFQTNPNLWLQVAADYGAGLQTFTPRVPFAAAPYAMHAKNADTVDGAHAAALEESAEIDCDIAAHNTSVAAHADIRTEIDTDVAAAVTAHDTNGTAHADIRTEIDTDIATHNADPSAHANNAVPVGTIIQVYLGLAGVPDTATLQSRGWALCDGTTATAQGITGAVITSATPNINGLGLFVRGSATAGTQQGDNVGTHGHGASFSAGSAASSGAHSHTYSGTTSTVGDHSHAQNVSANPGIGGPAFRFDFDQDSSNGAKYAQGISTEPAGTHNHTFSGTTSTDGAHTHTVTGTVTVNNNTPGGETRPVNISMVHFIKVK